MSVINATPPPKSISATLDKRNPCEGFQMTTLAEFSALLRDIADAGIVLDLTAGGKISSLPPPPPALRARLIAARAELITYLRTGRYVQDESTPSPRR